MEESEVIKAVSIKKTLEVIEYLNISNIQYNKSLLYKDDTIRVTLKSKPMESKVTLST